MNCPSCGSAEKVKGDISLSVSCDNQTDAQFFAVNRLKVMVCRECGHVDWKVVKDE